MKSDLYQTVESHLLAADYSALQQMDIADLRQVFWPMFIESNESLRLAITQVVGQLKSDVLSGLLIVGLKDRSSKVRARAAKELGFCQYQEALSALIQRLMMDPSSEVREASALALGQLASEKALSVLIHALSDSDEQVVRQVCRSLSRIPSRRQLRPLGLLIDRAQTPLVLVEAISALGAIDGLDIMVLLIRMLSDSRAIVRSEALMALGSKHVDWLQNYFEIFGGDADIEVRRSAFWASSLQETEQSQAYLNEAVKHMCKEYLGMAQRVLDMYHPRSPYY